MWICSTDLLRKFHLPSLLSVFLTLAFFPFPSRAVSVNRVTAIRLRNSCECILPSISLIGTPTWQFLIVVLSPWSSLSCFVSRSWTGSYCVRYSALFAVTFMIAFCVFHVSRFGGSEINNVFDIRSFLPCLRGWPNFMSTVYTSNFNWYLTSLLMPTSGSWDCPSTWKLW